MKCALVMIAKVPTLGYAKTRLAKTIGDQAALDWYRYFLKRIISTHNKQPEYDFWISSRRVGKKDYFTEEYGVERVFDQTQEKDLGKIMLHGISKLLEEYDKVILVGSDLPLLSKETVLHGFKELEDNDVVIGPAHDGGYYLIGMKKPHEIFDTMTWSVDTVLKEQIKRIEEKYLTYAILEEHRDIDEEHDLKWYQNQGLLPEKPDF